MQLKVKIIIFVGLLQCLFALSQNSNPVFVDSKNAQNGSGSISDPYKTIQLAVLNSNSGDSIIIRGGTYREEVTLTKSNLSIVAYPNEKVTINGTNPLLNWVNTTGSVYKTKMKWNVTESDQTNQLFCNGSMMDLVRWPANTGSVLLKSNAYADNVIDNGTNFVILDADFQEPKGKWDGCEIYINLAHGWDGQGWSGRIISSEPGKIVLQGKASGVLGENQGWSLGKNTEYYLFNPSASTVNLNNGIENYLKHGEWWKNGKDVYVKTFDGQMPAMALDGTNLIEAKKRLYSIAFADKSNIKIIGINTFANTINTDVVSFYNRVESVCGSSNILIDGVKAKFVTHFTDNTGQFQMQWLQRSGFIISGSNITLQNSEIQYSAGSGISVFGVNNKILNNKIWDVNYTSAECGAINCGKLYDPGQVISKDNEIAYNTIYNTLQQAINFRALRNSNEQKPGMARIHHNTICDYMLKSNDSGAFDTYLTDGVWVRVDHNVVYNAVGNLKVGFYMDFGTRYICDHNLFFNVADPILLNEGGWDPNPNAPSDVWIVNNTAFSTVLGQNGIINYAGGYPSGFRILNNITSSEQKDNYPLPLVQKNIYPKSSADMIQFFTNTANEDYTLNVSQSPGIDIGNFTPFCNQIINKPDAGCFEAGLPKWTAGQGNIKKEFLLIDNMFSIKTTDMINNSLTFPVYSLGYCHFSGVVDLTISELPNGIVANLSANKVQTGQSVNLNISVSNELSPGSYVFKLVGVSGELTATRYYTVEVPQGEQKK